MKTMVKNILLVLLVSCYSVSMTGVAIYNCHCHCNHSGKIVLLTKDKCACQQEHKCCKDHEHEPATEEHCCDIIYEVLQLDQAVDNTDFAFNSYSIAKALLCPVMLIGFPVLYAFVSRDYDPPPLSNSPTPDIYCLAQLRL